MCAHEINKKLQAAIAALNNMPANPNCRDKICAGRGECEAGMEAVSAMIVIGYHNLHAVEEINVTATNRALPNCPYRKEVIAGVNTCIEATK